MKTINFFLAALSLGLILLIGCSQTDEPNAPSPARADESSYSLQKSGCVTPSPGMVNWWPGDGDAIDIVGGHHGTLQNGATFAPGMVGLAFSFVAPGDMVQIADNPDLNLESLPASTFEGWFKSAGGSVSGGGTVIAKHMCGISNGWFFNTNQGGYIGDHHIGGVGVGGLNLNDNQFHHFACVKDGTTYSEYIDGVLIASDTGPAFGTPTAQPVQIGSHVAGGCYPALHQLYGLVDELTIYNRALSADEILAIYNAGSAGKCKKVTICHKPGTPAQKTLVIPLDALPAHLGHGDVIGPCQ